MEKLLLLVVLCLCSGFAEGQKTRRIVTSGSGSGDWYQSTGIGILGSNQLVFQVKGSRDAILGLATDDTDDTMRWRINIGGAYNQKDSVNDKWHGNICDHKSPLSQTEYRTFWLSWDNKSIRLGRGDTVGVNQYCEQTSTDTNTPTDFYLRLGSWKQNTVNWIVHLNAKLSRHIEISSSGTNDWYQSTGIRITDTNELVFEAKGSRDALLILATKHKYSARRWNIVIGGGFNARDILRYKYGSPQAQSVHCNHSSLSQSDYRKFWLSWDNKSIRLGRGDTVGEDQYCELTSTDTNIPTDFYLMLGSWKQNTVNWIIHLKTQMTQHIQTSDSRSGDWFQSTGIGITGSNQVVFEAKGSRDAILGLATQDNDATIRWTIVVGDKDQNSVIRYKNEWQHSSTCNDNSLSSTEYRVFWLSWDNKSIRLGRGYTVGANQYCELTTPGNFPTDFYLRLGSWKRNTIDWIIRGLGASCGHRPLADYDRIVGGSTSTPHSWPWQVSLRNSYGHHLCGGSLIGNNYILTAAHCKPWVGQSIYIGGHYRTQCREPCKRVIVTGVWEHRDYDDSIYSGDIVIVKFSPSVTFNDAISPICLPEADYSPYNSDTECYATGWGTLSSGGPLPNELQEVKLPIVPQTQCTNLERNFEEQTMVCAGNVTKGGIDTCQGDSGGPLACHTIGEDHWTLFGITSHGFGCAEPRHPGVYTKVTNYLQWIENKMKE